MLTALLPSKFQPYAKALAAPLGVVVAAVIAGIFTGEWDLVGLQAAVTAIVATLVVFRTPNVPPDA